VPAGFTLSGGILEAGKQENIMGLPKRKHSKTRKRKRRTNWKLGTPGLTKCSHCGQAKTPHSVCPNCGFYAGREVVRIEEEL